MSIQPISGGATTLPVAVLPQAPQVSAPRAQETSPQLPAGTRTGVVTGAVDTAEGRNAPSLSKEETRASVRDAVNRANETVQVLRSNLQFTVDETTGIDVIKFIDIKTKEVIRQIPSEEMIALARRLDELKGLLIKEKA